jgi:hypothetical protein
MGHVLAGSTHRSGGMSPITMALLGVLAYRTLQGKGRGRLLGPEAKSRDVRYSAAVGCKADVTRTPPKRR